MRRRDYNALGYTLHIYYQSTRKIIPRCLTAQVEGYLGLSIFLSIIDASSETPASSHALCPRLALPWIWILPNLPDSRPYPGITLKAQVDQIHHLLRRKIKAQFTLKPQVLDFH